MTTFHCAICQADKPTMNEPGGTGYARWREGEDESFETARIICYDCCAVMDRIALRDSNRYTLYLGGDGVVSNWCGTLKIVPDRIKAGRSRVGKYYRIERNDVWFTEDEFGSRWHGFNVGDNQLLHCRKLKRRDDRPGDRR